METIMANSNRLSKESFNGFFEHGQAHWAQIEKEDANKTIELIESLVSQGHLKEEVAQKTKRYVNLKPLD